MVKLLMIMEQLRGEINNMKQQQSKFLMSLSILALCLIGLVTLSACGKSPDTNDRKKAETSETVEQKLDGNISLSKALPKYKIWYKFYGQGIEKRSVPSAIYVFDGKHTTCYPLRPEGSFPEEFPVKPLTISELLKMTDDEQIKYAESCFANYEQKSVYSVISEVRNIESISNSPQKSNRTCDFILHITTDGSGNGTQLESFVATGNSLERDRSFKRSEWKKYSEVLTIQPTTVNIQFPIYDHLLKGYSLVDSSGNEEEGLLLTNVGADFPTFELDTPQDKSDLIKVDE